MRVWIVRPGTVLNEDNVVVSHKSVAKGLLDADVRCYSGDEKASTLCRAKYIFQIRPDKRAVATLGNDNVIRRRLHPIEFGSPCPCHTRIRALLRIAMQPRIGIGRDIVNDPDEDHREAGITRASYEPLQPIDRRMDPRQVKPCTAEKSIRMTKVILDIDNEQSCPIC
jgi:hypothetical protein